ncbi:MAG: lyase family protein [Planctomycetota bacterium]|jgi:argininosuccinate lyase
MLRDRFAGEASDAFDDINRSLPFDRAMAAHDIAGSRAHVAMLGKCGILTAEEASTIDGGLAQIAQEVEASGVPDDPASEDIHLWVEKRLGELVGPVAGKLHTGRSRNDQVALDQRLELAAITATLTQALEEAQRALLKQARANLDVVLPFYTHLQRAQPVLLAHHLLAHVEALRRDGQRLTQCRDRALSHCPLGRSIPR